MDCLPPSPRLVDVIHNPITCISLQKSPPRNA